MLLLAVRIIARIMKIGLDYEGHEVMILYLWAIFGSRIKMISDFISSWGMKVQDFFLFPPRFRMRVEMKS